MSAAHRRRGYPVRRLPDAGARGSLWSFIAMSPYRRGEPPHRENLGGEVEKINGYVDAQNYGKELKPETGGNKGAHDDGVRPSGTFNFFSEEKEIVK